MVPPQVDTYSTFDPKPIRTGEIASETSGFHLTGKRALHSRFNTFFPRSITWFIRSGKMASETSELLVAIPHGKAGSYI
jgi:hypothetical protein